MRAGICPNHRNRKDEVDVILIIVTESVAVIRSDEGVRKQKPEMVKLNTLHVEKEDDNFKKTLTLRQ